MKRRLAFVLGWWTSLFVIWLLLTDSLDGIQVGVGAAAAAIATLAAEVVRRRSTGRFEPDPRWATHLLPMPLLILRDCVLVLWALVLHLLRVRRVRGEFRRVPYEAGGEEPRSAAARALVITLSSLPPNTYVVDLDTDSSEALVHQLVPRFSGAPERAIVRVE